MIMDSKGRDGRCIRQSADERQSLDGRRPAVNELSGVGEISGHAAAQQAQANFPGATQSEVHMQFNELSPNVSMDDATIKKLLNTNIRSTDYALKVRAT